MTSSKREKCRVVCSLLLLLVVTLMAVINARAAEPEVLNLDQLIAMALEKSPEIKEADQDIAVAQSDLDQAKAGRWAQLDITGVTGPVEDADLPTVVVNETLGNGLFLGELQNNDKDRIGVFGRLDFNLVQPLYTFGKISHRQDAAAFGVEAQKSARIKKNNDIILSIKELYYALIVAGQGKDAAQDADGFIRDARQRIEKLIAAGSSNVDETDLYRLDAFEADIQRFKVKADSGAQLAYTALKRTIGYPAAKDFKLDRYELPKDMRTLADREEYIRRALETRPELEQLEKGLQAQKSMLDAAKADLYPSFFLAGVASLAGAPGRERMPISYFEDDFNHAYVGVLLGGQWHFDFGIGQGKVRKAAAEYQKLLHKRDFAEQSIPLQVAKEYQDVLEARSSYISYEKAAKASRKWIVASFANFDMGVGTAKDMFEAIDRYGKNQGDYLRALFDYHVALARLEYASGIDVQSGP